MNTNPIGPTEMLDQIFAEVQAEQLAADQERKRLRGQISELNFRCSQINGKFQAIKRMRQFVDDGLSGPKTRVAAPRLFPFLRRKDS